ncbi:MAG: hypothetical protein V4495_21965 [Pseudomonadota bacterium]
MNSREPTELTLYFASREERDVQYNARATVLDYMEFVREYVGDGRFSTSDPDLCEFAT